MAQHNDVVVAKIYDQLESHLPEEDFIAGNGDVQAKIQGSKSKVRKKYAEKFEDDFDAFKSTLQKHRIQSFLINTNEALEDQIKRYFKKSSARK